MELTTEGFSILMKQIVKTMGMNPVSQISDGGSYLFMNCGWCLYWPEDQIDSVLITFHNELDPNVAAEITMRFSRIPDLMGIQVVVENPDSESDSTVTIETGETVH